MKCPIFTIGGYDNSHLPKYGWNDCLKEECAWWDDVEEHCSVLMGVKLLARLAMWAAKIADKMPHGTEP